MLCCALVLTACTSGTITGSQQTCKSSGGLFEQEMACTGSVASVRGEPTLGIIDTDENLSGTYKLDAIITVGKGMAYISTEGDGQTGGKVSPDEPLRISAVVGVDEVDDEVSVNVKVRGNEVKDLRYDATLLPQD